MTRLAATLAAAALLAALAGCGSDSSGETSTGANANAQTSISIPSPTSPIPTTTTTSTTGGAGGNKKPAQTTTTTGGSAPTCSIPVAYEDFKYTGLDCSAAVAVASAWDQNGKTCNTVDNPESPIGPQRTCSVEGYSCTAKRDIHSDARFVTCTQGGQSVRFTWLPA
jgi:curli biogenesis system outer membrane secretion channel CsgG